jgi:hypothetical protein
MRTETPRMQGPGEPASTLRSLRVGEPSVSKHDAIALRVGRRDSREHLCEIEFHCTPQTNRPVRLGNSHATDITHRQSDRD